MTVEEIIKAVRFCYDEEATDSAAFRDASAQDNTYMDHIIESKIGDAVRWICLYSPAELLGGSDESDSAGKQIETGIIVDAEVSKERTTDNGVELIEGSDCMRLRMPPTFIKLSRVRVSGWHKAIKTPILEDSEEYLQLYDENGATATNDRPVAAIIDKSKAEIELWPMQDDAVVSVSFVSSTDGYVFDKETDDGGTETAYALPPRVKTAFIYYLAFLVLSAYEDSRAKRMLEIAQMNIGK